jgi:cytochrome d ubiquinol oxidase subunit II
VAKAGDPWSSWINPTSIVGGLLAIAVCAYLSAVYLVWDAHRVEALDLAEYFRRRALGASIAAGLIAFVGIFVFRSDAEYLYEGLTSRALPLVIASAICGIASLVLLLRGRSLQVARLLSIGAVATVVVGWGVAQWPYMLPESLKVSQAAGPTGTLEAVLVVFVVAAVVILPSLGLLYVLMQKSLLEGEGVDDDAKIT